MKSDSGRLLRICANEGSVLCTGHLRLTTPADPGLYVVYQKVYASPSDIATFITCYYVLPTVVVNYVG